MPDYSRQRRPHKPSGPAQRGALDTHIRTVRRRIVGGSLIGTAAFTILAGYQTLSTTTVADAATGSTDAASVVDVVPATATALLFADQGGVAVTTPTATTGATATTAPTATATASGVIGAISTPATSAKSAASAAPTATATATTPAPAVASTAPAPAPKPATKRGKTASS